MRVQTKMAQRFEQERLMLKVLEEMAELNEVMLKTITKTEDLRPPREKIVEEIGDVQFRMDILIEKMGIEDEVKQRYADKEKQITEWYSKKYESVK